MKVCSSNVVELFSEKVVNRSIYVEDFKRLKKESLALSLSIKNYHYENNYTCKFIDGNSNSVAKLRYLTDRLVILRKLNIPRRMKTMQNEYLAKLHELNRMLRQEFTWNSVELKKMIQVVRENEVEVTEHTRLLFQKISKEELLRDISTRSGGNQLEYPLLTPSENLTQRNRSLQATILSLKDRRGDDRRDRFTSDNDIAMNIIEKKESALFKLFAKELSDHMTASLQLTVKALSLKNRSMDSIVNNYGTCFIITFFCENSVLQNCFEFSRLSLFRNFSYFIYS